MLFVNGFKSQHLLLIIFYADEEHVRVKLNKKTNKVIMKLFNKDWDWKLKVRVLDDNKVLFIQIKNVRQLNITSF